jgi:hypothetical protein
MAAAYSMAGLARDAQLWRDTDLTPRNVNLYVAHMFIYVHCLRDWDLHDKATAKLQEIHERSKPLPLIDSVRYLLEWELAEDKTKVVPAKDSSDARLAMTVSMLDVDDKKVWPLFPAHLMFYARKKNSTVLYPYDVPLCQGVAFTEIPDEAFHALCQKVYNN